MIFQDILKKEQIYLYCGDYNGNNKSFIGLSLHQSNDSHIKHDITLKTPLFDNSVDIIQSEDVFEHIDYEKLHNVIDEFYRILKPGGLLRISVPDYRCDVLYNRSVKDSFGNVIFDKGGGGSYDQKTKKVIGGGHVWFPNYEKVSELLCNSAFKKEGIIEFLHYYDENNTPVMKSIDYQKGYIQRTPDHDKRVQNPRRPMSIVVDCYKKK